MHSRSPHAWWLRILRRARRRPAIPTDPTARRADATAAAHVDETLDRHRALCRRRGRATGPARPSTAGTRRGRRAAQTPCRPEDRTSTQSRRRRARSSRRRTEQSVRRSSVSPAGRARSMPHQRDPPSSTPVAQTIASCEPKEASRRHDRRDRHRSSPTAAARREPTARSSSGFRRTGARARHR